MLFSPVVIVLVAISRVGTTAIPFGDAQFLDRTVALELSFIMIALLTYKGFHKRYMPAFRFWRRSHSLSLIIYFQL
jgi:hypothetical protein